MSSYSSMLRDYLLKAGYSAEQVSAMLGDQKLEVELDETEEGKGKDSSGSNNDLNLDVLGAMNKGGGNGISLGGGQGISYSPSFSGGTGTATSGGAADTVAGYGVGDLGGGLSSNSSGHGLQMGSAKGIEYSPGIEGGSGTASSGGSSASSGGSWMSAAAGAMAGINTAYKRRDKYEKQGTEDPYMARGKEEGFGKYHEDYRDVAGGGTLGGVLGYFGGPVGAAVAEPVVEWFHPYGEKISRTMVKTGDDLGGAGGAMLLDPIGTMASGKYKWKDVIGGGIFGPAWKLFGGE